MSRIRRDTVLRRLVAARDLISDKSNWSQGYEAQLVDEDGDLVETGVDDPDATTFCATGAIRRVCFRDTERTGNEVHVDECIRRVGLNLPKEFQPEVPWGGVNLNHTILRLLFRT